MYASCKICGHEDKKEKLIFRTSPFGYFCPSCSKYTPKKASRRNFDKAYWGKDKNTVPESTKIEFYSDYCASECTLSEYISQTTGR